MLNTKQISHKNFIFDFDGTIADTLSLLVEISNQLANDFKFKTIDPKNIKDFVSVHILLIFMMKSKY